MSDILAIVPVFIILLVYEFVLLILYLMCIGQRERMTTLENRVEELEKQIYDET